MKQNQKSLANVRGHMYKRNSRILGMYKCIEMCFRRIRITAFTLHMHIQHERQSLIIP